MIPLVELRDLHVGYRVRGGIVPAVDGVSLAIASGSAYGLVGESGSGKSTLARAALRLLSPTGGSVHFDGVDLDQVRGERLRRLRRRMQLVFQDPAASLDPRQDVESALMEGLIAHGLPAGSRLSAVLDAVGLPAGILRRYPHELSGGQLKRVAIARALVIGPELLVADEPTAALDSSTRAQVVSLLAGLRAQGNLTYLVIGHDLAVIRQLSDRIGVLYLGDLVEEAPARQLCGRPLHPYTRALLAAVPVPDPAAAQRDRPVPIAGEMPPATRRPAGCRFHPRCRWARTARCPDERPRPREIRPGHWVACHWAEEIDASGLG